MRDEGVAGVVAAILLIAGLTAFLAVVRVSWLPVWTEDAEAAHVHGLRSALSDWADAAEDHVARGLAGRTFSRALPVGAPGIAVPLVGAGPPVQGTAAVEAGPTLTVTVGGTTAASASGALAATSLTSRHPPQTLRYVLGALEVNQSGESWVDLRSLLSAERAPGGKLNLAVQTLTLTGGNQSVGTGGEAEALGTVNSTATASQGAGTVRVLAEGVAGGAWRAAAQRVLQAAGLDGESLADCSGSTKKWCLDADNSPASTLDLYLFNVASGWRTTSGVVRVEVRA